MHYLMHYCAHKYDVYKLEIYYKQPFKLHKLYTLRIALINALRFLAVIGGRGALEAYRVRAKRLDDVNRERRV